MHRFGTSVIMRTTGSVLYFPPSPRNHRWPVILEGELLSPYDDTRAVFVAYDIVCSPVLATPRKTAAMGGVFAVVHASGVA